MPSPFYKLACAAGIVFCGALSGCQREQQPGNADEPKTKVSSILAQLSSPLIPYNIEHIASDKPTLKIEGPISGSVASQQE